MPGNTLRECLGRAARYLKDSGAPTPRLDAEVLLAHVLGRDRVYLYREADLVLSEECRLRYRALLRRRAGGEPVAYLTGHKEFMGLDFMVGPHVLIPRPETELMVEKALAVLAGWSGEERIAVDVGTGSGAVAVSLARLAPPGTRVYATDISTRALDMARANAARHSVPVSFYAGDLLTPLDGVLPAGSVALICANLPYIPSRDLAGLPRDVRQYEPVLALDGGVDGLELYRRLVPRAGTLLAPGGHLFMEIGPEQAQAALSLLAPAGWRVRLLRDLAGHPRLVWGTRYS
ncbi:peptide chain release factor N(5)-glutamine methyltransferase [Desulfallas thermosapovorans]|uniref:Release factor glutamine methyltransferase n=1 Tax=Desulfallas thermosapovorans DSM 6562 TaxID=1121431 RepID=A0A5S4ZUR7_9FIRM|nr:peptide chain release factor N(5)-glutamine methyltransferase [Desulfallas thermosapovorans]TYO96542.1 release factor glutamine methyltransferase [Desulfallas thermosapovorans DSM 6562]